MLNSNLSFVVYPIGVSNDEDTALKPNSMSCHCTPVPSSVELLVEIPVELLVEGALTAVELPVELPA